MITIQRQAESPTITIDCVQNKRTVVEKWIILGTSDMAEAEAALWQNLPQVVGGVMLESVDLEYVPQDCWRATARYSTRAGEHSGNNQGQQQEPEASWEFSTGGEQQHISESLGCMALGSPSGAGFVPDNGNAINANPQGVEGIDVLVPQFKFTLTLYLPAETMTAAYIGRLYALTGTINDKEFTIYVDGLPISFARGELLFLGVSGSKRGANEYELRYEFAASPTRRDYMVGDIRVPLKEGWQYQEVQFEQRQAEQGAPLSWKPVLVRLHDVYEHKDWTGLLP